MQFSKDGKILASGSRDKTIKLWRVKTGSIIRTLYGHKGWVRSVEFSSSSDVLVSGGRDKTIRLWDVSSGNELDVLASNRGVLMSATLLDNGNLISVDTNSVNIWGQ